ncbi:MAG: SdiA-regulated domain-containing protein [Gemmatimonadota bacterium]|nr:MAG: SdiA-regulated domain-containing protein [Gemmatimonadota bacterium]
MMPRTNSLVCCGALLLHVALLAAGALSGQSGGAGLGGFALDGESAIQWKLHSRIREVSGLTTTPDDRVWAHDDEWGIIYQLDISNGEVVKVFAFGDPGAKGDFEGIAFADDRFYLVESDGRIYEGPEGAHDERVLYNTYETRIGRRCEVEGLEYDPTDRVLLILCKRPRVEALEDHVGIFRWSLDTKALLTDVVLIPESPLAEGVDEKRFNPSGLARNPQTGTYFVIAAQQRGIAEVTLDGEVLAVRRVSKDLHRQPEGITFTSGPTLLIADEGIGKRARLTLYRPSR